MVARGCDTRDNRPHYDATTVIGRFRSIASSRSCRYLFAPRVRRRLTARCKNLR